MEEAPQLYSQRAQTYIALAGDYNFYQLQHLLMN
jgi:hypothetical protein